MSLQPRHTTHRSAAEVRCTPQRWSIDPLLTFEMSGELAMASEVKISLSSGASDSRSRVYSKYGSSMDAL